MLNFDESISYTNMMSSAGFAGTSTRKECVCDSERGRLAYFLDAVVVAMVYRGVVSMLCGRVARRRRDGEDRWTEGVLGSSGRRKMRMLSKDLKLLRSQKSKHSEAARDTQKAKLRVFPCPAAEPGERGSLWWARGGRANTSLVA